MNTSPTESENERLSKAVAGLAATITEVIEARLREIEGGVENRIAQKTIQPMLDKRQAAKVFNVSVRKVENWMSRRLLPSIKIGRVVRIPIADAEASLREKCLRPARW